jgi:hypothetical protein
VAAAYLAFLQQEMFDNPGNLTGFDSADLTELAKLLDGVSVSDEDHLPDDVTF